MSGASVVRTIAVLGVTVALVGCGKNEATTHPAATTTAAVEAPLPLPITPFSINELMVMIVDQPGELLWDVEKPKHAPKTDEDWYQLEDHAVSLASAGTMIQLGGTGPADAGWVKQPHWRADAKNLVTAALAARTAAQAKDLPALVAANGQIVDACEACHKEYKPDIPTGKMFMHHRPGTH